MTDTMPMTREKATELVEHLLEAAGRYDRDVHNYGKEISYLAARGAVIDALMRGDTGMQSEA